MENTTTDLEGAAGLDKLRKMVKEIDVCLFCTDLKTAEGSTVRPMETAAIDDKGDIWFFSDVRSEKNRAIRNDKNVQLFYAHPPKSSYLVVNGSAEILIDRQRAEALWKPIDLTWFEGGIDDPNLSIIKVSPREAYYWDMESNQMVNIFRYVTAMVMGNSDIVGAKEGNILVS